MLSAEKDRSWQAVAFNSLLQLSITDFCPMIFSNIDGFVYYLFSIRQEAVYHLHKPAVFFKVLRIEKRLHFDNKYNKYYRAIPSIIPKKRPSDLSSLSRCIFSMREFRPFQRSL